MEVRLIVRCVDESWALKAERMEVGVEKKLFITHL